MATGRDLCKSRPVAGPIPDLAIPALGGLLVCCQEWGRRGVDGQIVIRSAL